MSQLPPGPRAPLVVQTLRWARAPLSFLEDAWATYGDAFTIRIAPWGAVVVLAHPDAVREVFAADPAVVLGGRPNRVVTKAFGEASVVVLDGPEHARQRKLLSPAFQAARMDAYGQVMLDLAGRRMKGWPRGATFALLPETLAITREVILRTVFGIEDGARMEELSALFATALDMLSSPALLVPALQRDLGPLSPWGRYARVSARIDAILLAEIAERRRGAPAEASRPRDDVLSSLLAARDDAGRPMTDRELRDELFTSLAAGHETTASSLAWAARWLASRQDVVARLRDELDGATDDAGALSPPRVAKLPFLDATVREVLRLCPILPLVGRELAADATIGGLRLRAGTVVAPAVHLVHRRPDLYPSPDAFRPERFADGFRPGPAEWLPFGGGARRCLGAAFATYEMKMVLAELVRELDVAIAPGASVAPERRGISLAPADGLRVRVGTRRRGGAAHTGG